MGSWVISQDDPGRGRCRPGRAEPPASTQALRTDPGAGQRAQRRAPDRDIADRERATRRPDQHDLQARQGLRPDTGTVHRRGPQPGDGRDVTTAAPHRTSMLGTPRLATFPAVAPATSRTGPEVREAPPDTD